MEVQENSLAAYLDELRDGLPLSREGACNSCIARTMNSQIFLPQPCNSKQRFKPGVITYSRKVFIPLTNLCRDYCGTASSGATQANPGRTPMTPDQVLEVATAGQKMGCTEALFSLGDKPELAFPEMRRLCATWDISRRCTTSKPCASESCARLPCCRIPIRGC